MFKILLVLCFFAVLCALWISFFFMMKDKSKKRRMVNMLLVRVGLSFLLIALILWGYYSGALVLEVPPF